MKDDKMKSKKERGEAPGPVPGTTSKILWHFTGGAKVKDPKTGERFDEPKPDSEAYKHLESIVVGRKLWAGEEILCESWKGKLIPRGLTYICSVAEIPIQHLQYHAQRYGRFAIGFHRENLKGRLRFRPVHYAFNHDDWVIYYAYQIYQVFFNEKEKVALSAQRIFELQQAASNHLAFIKPFSEQNYGDIYCEREWRVADRKVNRKYLRPLRKGDYVRFSPRDVCFLICPRRYVKRLKREIDNNGLSDRYSHVPIVPYEDLLEH